jgi:hypothetical protein
MPTKSSNLLSTIAEQIPLYTVLLIVVSYFNMYNYYNMFAIPIYNYIDVSEIIFSISSTFNLIFMTIAMLAGVGVYKAIMGDREGEPRKDETRNGRVKKVFLLLGLYWMPALCTIGIAVGVIIVPFYVPEFLIDLYFAIYILWVFTDFSDMEYIQLYPRYRRLMQYTLVIFFTMLFFTTKNYAWHKAVILGAPKYNIEMKLKDNTVISSTNNFHYIGSTAKFIFMYDAFSKKSMTYSKDDVMWSSIKANRSYIRIFDDLEPLIEQPEPD